MIKSGNITDLKLELQTSVKSSNFRSVGNMHQGTDRNVF